MSKKDKHIHQYRKVKLENSTVFKCALPGCRHYLRAKLAEGALSICNRCGNPMILNKRSMKLSKPHCDDCVVHRDERLNAIKELLTGTLP